MGYRTKEDELTRSKTNCGREYRIKDRRIGKREPRSSASWTTAWRVIGNVDRGSAFMGFMSRLWRS
jgi:hypothetical protein